MGWINSSTYLSQDEMENNATLFIQKCRSLGVNDVTIAALLGNAQAESTLNPILNEVGGSGYGLVQWTPKSVLTEHCSTLGLSPYTNGYVQIECMYNEILGTPSSVNEWYSTTAFLSQGDWFGGAGESSMVGITGSQFLNNSGNWDCGYLARLFMCAYERPAHDPTVNHWERRVENARNWLAFLGGVDPDTPIIPDIPTGKRKKMPVWMMCRPWY